MALRNDDRAWVNAEINTALASLKPSGWKKLSYWLREWGVVGITVSVILALLGLLVTVSIYAAEGIVKNAEFRTHTEDRLTDIEARLDKITGTLSTISLTLLTNKPISPQSVSEAKKLLNAAISSKIEIDASAISSAGTKLVAASQAVPSAWDTALEFASYKSSLNASAAGVPQIVKHSITTRYLYASPNGEASPQLSVYGDVPKDQAALLNKLGEDLNNNLTRGNQVIFVTGGGLILDGMQFKNVVFRGVHITYHGAPVKMENVYFVDCTFSVERISNGVQFADAVLSPGAATTFSGL